jgi:ATP-dependent Lon protease
MRILSLRDLVVSTPTDIMEEIKKKYNDYRSLQAKPLLSLINEFLLASKYRKIDILTLLLMSFEEDHKLAFVLFDVFKTKDKKDVASEIYQSLHYSIRELLDISKNTIEKEEQELSKISDSDIPYERRINLMKTDDNVKSKAMDKLKAMKSSFQGDSKAQAWLDGLLKIPFNTYSVNDVISFKETFLNKINSISSNKLFSDNDVNNYIDGLKLSDPENSMITEWEQYKVEKKDYLINVRKTLDGAVYGHKDAKLQLERIFAQWINGESKGAVLGLQGPPGTGKTSLAKNGLSKCLTDKNGKQRPFAFLPIGGSVNGSTLVGHNFTYVGSTWGRIVDILITTECMNPIIFIDEIDKVSHTEHGREIISILTHLTDATQNDEFEDKFFAGIKLDLSKALIVFSFNDPDLIDPILKDRITIIETHPLSLKEKITIIQDYMFPEICKEVGFNKGEIILEEEIIRFMIETYTNEAGVRKIKEKIVEIIRDINLNRFHSDSYSIPFKITKEYVVRLFENRPKVRVKKIHKNPSVGMVNGLYATSSGIGGITPIQATKFPSEKMLELMLTGKAGDVMKESVQYALKVAFALLSKEEQDKIIEDSHNKKSFGIHIHCPDGATPKDGPSAGLAFTLAIYSLLTNKKVDNMVCMTGEIDLFGNAGIIGGLESKLNGGKKAGCTLALIPEDNMEDLERLRREGLSPEDDTFKVISVESINDIIANAIINE